MIVLPLLLIMLPLSMMRKLEGLSHTSVISMVCVMFIIGAISLLLVLVTVVSDSYPL
jgi:hypothetical protein